MSPGRDPLEYRWASHALLEEISIVDGKVQQSNFHDCRVLRMSEAPQVHVEILESVESVPAGIGEVGLPPVAPAIANAVARLTGGRRLRHLPFSPDRVRSAISA
jgi:isoquinoline 1-oxidoreductase subunit beta